uniref:Uncharacterized protein n=1 Tax=Oryza brachyantha TaxID=4533 RepID=J3M3H8_ORYBR
SQLQRRRRTSDHTSTTFSSLFSFFFCKFVLQKKPLVAHKKERHLHCRSFHVDVLQTIANLRMMSHLGTWLIMILLATMH